MTYFFFFLGLTQCFFLWLLGNTGKKLIELGEKEIEEAEKPSQIWPPCILVIPVAGKNIAIEPALRTLCEQDYPDYAIFLVTSEEEKDALPIIETLLADYPHLSHIKAPCATKSSQKNINLLTAIAKAPERAEIYAFCDSTHLARPDFLRCLILPLARKEAAFSTGYHKVIPRNESLVSLAYALTVTFMRLLQALGPFTQPWGGAMAMTREAFTRYKIAELWENSVVDDCSLAALLQKKGTHPKLCPGALLLTWTKDYPFSTWEAWLERQILFLKFCMRPQWIALGIFSLLMLLPSLWAFWAILGGILNVDSPVTAFLGIIWFLLLASSLLGWRAVLAENVPFWRWLPPFFLALFMFAKVCLATIRCQTLCWNHIEYLVDPGGKVEGVLRKDTKISH